MVQGPFKLLLAVNTPFTSIWLPSLTPVWQRVNARHIYDSLSRNAFWTMYEPEDVMYFFRYSKTMTMVRRENPASIKCITCLIKLMFIFVHNSFKNWGTTCISFFTTLECLEEKFSKGWDDLGQFCQLTWPHPPWRRSGFAVVLLGSRAWFQIQTAAATYRWGSNAKTPVHCALGAR